MHIGIMLLLNYRFYLDFPIVSHSSLSCNSFSVFSYLSLLWLLKNTCEVFCRNLSVWDCHMFSHALTKVMYFRKVYRDEVFFPVHHIRDILSWYILHLVVLTLVIWLSWLSVSFLYYKAFSPHILSLQTSYWA